MRKAICLFFGILLISLSAGAAWAASLGFGHAVSECRWIDASGSGPAANGWFQFPFPDEGLLSDYDSGLRFEYDDVVADLTEFTITLRGHNDNSGEAINVWFSFDDRATKVPGAAFDVPDEGSCKYFELKLDLLANDLFYRGDSTGWVFTDVGNLATGFDPSIFVGYDEFWIGYGCHFNHDETVLRVAAVPTPGALLLFGSGLAGLLALRRRA